MWFEGVTFKVSEWMMVRRWMVIQLEGVRKALVGIYPKGSMIGDPENVRKLVESLVEQLGGLL